MGRPVRNPAGLEPAPTHTHPLSAKANGCMRTRFLIEERRGRRVAKGATWRISIEPREKNHDYANCCLVVTGAKPGQPRKTLDRRSLEGLAASSRNDGLLQNLVVSPLKG
jgi:hypothetical protein